MYVTYHVQDLRWLDISKIKFVLTRVGNPAVGHWSWKRYLSVIKYAKIILNDLKCEFGGLNRLKSEVRVSNIRFYDKKAS